MKRKPSFFQRLRYLLNERISKGLKQQSLMLLIFICIVILVMGILAVVFKAVPSIGEGLWKSFTHLLDPGTVSGNDLNNIPLLILMVLVTLVGMAFTGLLISIINNALEDKLSSLRQGATPVLEENHMILFGCNSNTYTVLREQILANLNLPKNARHAANSVIVVVDTYGKEEMEHDVQAHIDDFCNTKIICRSGKLTQGLFFSTIALESANSIVLCTETDAESLKILLAIRNYLKPMPECRPRIVAQFYDRRILQAAQTALADHRTNLLYCEDVLSRITAQVCRQPGLSYVLHDLFNYEDDEFYIESKDAAGKTLNFDGQLFRDVIGQFANCTVIGVRRLEKVEKKADGKEEKKYKIIIDPDRDFRLKKDDEIIHLAEDDCMIELAPAPAVPAQTPEYQFVPLSTGRIDLLVLEWNHKLPTILRCLDEFVAPGSTAKIISARPVDIQCQLQNISVCTELSALLEDPEYLSSLMSDSLTNILLLCDDSIPPEDADSNTMMRLLQLRRIVEKREEDSKVKSTIVFTSELKNPDNQRLMDVAKVNDFIVGSEFTNRVITQIANQPDLQFVFEELLTAEGAEIYLRPASAYVDITENRDISFAELTRVCYEQRDIAIGWMTYDKDGTLKRTINPSKIDTHRFVPGEEIIVISQGM